MLEPPNEISTQYRYKANKGNHPIIGIDTETIEGYVRVIADSLGRNLKINNWKQLKRFLTYRKYRSKFNLFYNLRYDFFAIMKYLPVEIWEEIYNEGFAIYDDLRIRYIPKKLLSIKDKHKHIYNFYDVAQFYSMSLNNAVKEYLGVHNKEYEKTKDLRANLFEKLSIDKIKEYCIQDAVFTAKLGKLFQKKFQQATDFNLPKPISVGYLAQKYFCNKCYIPTINDLPKELIMLAYQSYYGGRFEVFKRGYFDKVYMYDIHSAYPDKIKDLIDITKGKWKKVENLNESAYYGFYNVEVYENNYIGTLPYRNKKGLVYFPNGLWQGVYTKHELERLKEKGGDFEVLYGWEYYPDYIKYPFKKSIEHLYNERIKARERGDEAIYLTYKLIMNSLYGKFVQKTDIRKDGKKYLKTGKLFNPIYGSMITALTRLQLMKNVNENNIISVATDSIETTEPIELKEGLKLGEWEKEKEGEGVFIISGIYKINDKEKVRGFSKEIWKLLPENKDKKEITIHHKYPVTLGEVINFHNKYDKIDLNLFKPRERTLNINNEKKRVWERDFESINDMLNNNIDSNPKWI